MNRLIVDNESNRAFLNNTEISHSALAMFEPKTVPGGEYHRRVYYSGHKHYLRAKTRIKTLEPKNESFDSLFEKIPEIIAIDKRIVSGQLKMPKQFEG